MIDWADLYENHNGFLLFEKLKAQWKDVLRLDYVLIDSRTGHTDIAGICTRQLPHSVVMVFMPNKQNLIGLKKVVRDIVLDKKGPGTVHFVASNVPDLDDRDESLGKQLQAFRKEIGWF